ncbi:MAG TPA: phenylacetate--CoA ligase, partial [Candidatus Hydrogenedentes bacterium]|nr:phenylacetate--CoA ligase [Candidatus Hydrogenedentota bacterium]
MKHGKQTSGGGFNPVSAPDYLPLAQLRQLQLDRLKSIVKRAYDNVLFHRQRMEEKGVTPGDIQSLEDITRLHFTMKDDLREAYPFGLFASPMEEVVRVHASSGTTGKPTVAAYTQEDINVWTNVMVRSFISCGCHRGDIIQNAYGYGLF